jgi:hypothetical protein
MQPATGSAPTPAPTPTIDIILALIRQRAVMADAGG